MKRFLFFLLIVLGICLCGCLEYPPTEKSHEETAHYEIFIETIRDGMLDNFQTKTIEELQISTVFKYGPEAHKTLGYAFVDIDKNGVDELIFGELSTYKGNTIYNVYTFEDSSIIQVVNGWERNRYYLCENNIIANEGSGGAALSIYSYYTYSEDGLIEFENVIYDGWEDEESPWFYSVHGQESKDAISITKEEALSIINGYVYLEIQFEPFIKAEGE